MDAFGLKINLHPLEPTQLAKLPLYLRSFYKFYNGSIIGSKLIWAKIKENDEWTPDQLQKQGQQLQHLFDAQVVFVIDGLQSWNRKRLIEKRIAFAQPFKQLYIPHLFVQLGDTAQSAWQAEDATAKLSAPAQLALLYHLQVQSIENRPFQQLAEQLQYSAMTVTRIMQELKSAKLLHVKTADRKKTGVFYDSGKELWGKAKSKLLSPVREQWFTDELPSNKNFYLAGDTALAEYTLLAETGQKTYAIGKDEFGFLKKSGELKQLDKKYGDFKIEVWLYSLKLLSKAKEVDKLSLYLSMRGHTDERINRALDDLLNEMQW
jgi:DNA-binding MarR family transcriptional regulator